MLSIITWDANYRDFIYCIESLERQSLKHSQYEVLIVEQFSEKKRSTLHNFFQNTYKKNKGSFSL